MIKFFRQFRQSMIKENRVSKYLIYAIGEIVLVVIGILIALQINTKTKEIRNLAIERTSLENLKEDLIIQNEIIQLQIDHEMLMLAEVDSCNAFFDSSLGLPEVYRFMNDLSTRRTFVANRATFDNMGTTGSFVLITNQVLENAIIRYYQRLEYVSSVINNNNLFRIDNHFGAFVANNLMGFRLNESGTMDTNQILSPEKRFLLKAQLKDRAGSSQSNLNISIIQLEETEKLIQLIDKEIK